MYCSNVASAFYHVTATTTQYLTFQYLLKWSKLKLFSTESFRFLKIFEQNMKTSKHLWSKLKLFQQNIFSISVQTGWHRISGSLLCSPHTLVLSSQNSLLQHVVQTHSSANNQPRIRKIATHQKTHVCPRNAVSQADLESGIPSQPHYHRGITGTLFTIQELSIVVAISKNITSTLSTHYKLL